MNREAQRIEILDSCLGCLAKDGEATEEEVEILREELTVDDFPEECWWDDLTEEEFNNSIVDPVERGIELWWAVIRAGLRAIRAERGSPGA